MEPGADRRQEPRRTNDVELAELTIAFRDLREGQHEIKHLISESFEPRLKDLEDWRIALAATELERERNKHKEEANVISKRQFWVGIGGLMVAVVGATATLAEVITSYHP